MNDQQRAAMQMALEDLRVVWPDSRASITALREALAQPQDQYEVGTLEDADKFANKRMEQPQGEPDCSSSGDSEPVAWMRNNYDPETSHWGKYGSVKVCDDDVPLYTTPPSSPNLNCKSVQRRLATLWGYVRKEEYDMAIEATKEKAAKVCEECNWYDRFEAAAAIRSMK